MRAPAWILLVAALLAWSRSEAQIYECAGKDGSRVFSDKRCGPDAKVVQSSPKPKRLPPKDPSAKPVQTRESAAALEHLTGEGVAGDDKACVVDEQRWRRICSG